MVRSVLKQLLCKHDYKWYAVKESGFSNIRGEKRILACAKCEKVKKNAVYFAEYEGSGFK